MDNRIPAIIKDFVRNNPQDKEINFLSFNDWLSSEDNLSNDWIVIAQRGRMNDYSDVFTTSCLINANDEDIKGFLSNSNWYINASFGIPNKYQSPYMNESYDDGLEAYLEGVFYSPFTFFRHFNKYRSDRFEIIQKFLLYYNAYWVEETCEYHAINNNGEITVLVKHLLDEENDKEQMFVDSHCLRDYLAVNESYLARFHDHRRRSNEDISTFINSRFITHILKNNISFFELDLRTDIQYDEIKSTSRLIGKDLVLPYESPESHEIKFEKNDNQFLEFIIQRDKNGKVILSTCNPEKLSSYFVDKGAPHYLTPVYFKRELLQKYYSEPLKYKISEGRIEFLNIWSIDYDTTEENLVQVYIGDIGRDLPLNEQFHWKQYNVIPKGKITNHRFQRDFLAQSASPRLEEAPISYFKIELDLIQKKFKDKFGQYLFKELNKDDKYFYDTLHVPVTSEWKELDEQILGLAKITIDSFNSNLLKRLTGKNVGDKNSNNNEIKGTLGLFYEFLMQIHKEKEINEKIIEPFNIIQTLRSSSVAHRKSKEFNMLLDKFKLKQVSNDNKMKIIVIKLINSLKMIDL